MSQIDVFGVETPVDELDLGPVQQLIAKRIRDLEGSDPITADEAGAIIHAHRGKHDEDTRCRYCAIDGADALKRLRERLPLEERSSASHTRGRSSSGTPTGEFRSIDAAPESRSTSTHSEGSEAAGVGNEPGSGAALPRFDDDRAGYSHADGRDTERHAARRVMPRTGTARGRVLQLLARARENGKTDEELSLELGIRLYTAAPRRKELLDDGWIMDSGQRRPTTTGCMATVWTLTREARRDARLVQILRAAA